MKNGLKGIQDQKAKSRTVLFCCMHRNITLHLNVWQPAAFLKIC